MHTLLPFEKLQTVCNFSHTTTCLYETGEKAQAAIVEYKASFPLPRVSHVFGISMLSETLEWVGTGIQGTLPRPLSCIMIKCCGRPWVSEEKVDISPAKRRRLIQTKMTSLFHETRNRTRYVTARTQRYSSQERMPKSVRSFWTQCTYHYWKAWKYFNPVISTRLSDVMYHYLFPVQLYLPISIYT